MKTKTLAAVQQAAEAHSNIGAYQAVIALLEGGLLYAGRTAISFKMIQLAKAGQQEELKFYDAAVAKVAAIAKVKGL